MVYILVPLETNLIMLIPLTLKMKEFWSLCCSKSLWMHKSKVAVYKIITLVHRCLILLLESQCPAKSQHTCLDVFSNPKDLDFLVLVCLIRIGVAFQKHGTWNACYCIVRIDLFVHQVVLNQILYFHSSGVFYVVAKSYKAMNSDELSVEIGSVVEVLQKSDNGWWIVR